MHALYNLCYTARVSRGFIRGQGNMEYHFRKVKAIRDVAESYETRNIAGKSTREGWRERQISENRKCAGELGEGGTVWRQKAKDMIEAVIGDTFL